MKVIVIAIQTITYSTGKIVICVGINEAIIAKIVVINERGIATRLIKLERKLPRNKTITTITRIEP